MLDVWFSWYNIFSAPYNILLHVFPYNIWISKSLSPRVSQFIPHSAFSVCVGGSVFVALTVLTCTEVCDTHCGHPPACLYTRAALGRPTRQKLMSAAPLIHWPAALILCDAIESSALALHGHLMRVNKWMFAHWRCVGGGVRAAPIDEAPGSTPDNKSACRLLCFNFGWDVDSTCNTQMFSD